VITDAILWVSNPALLLRRVAGLTVVERHLHTLARAGLRRVWVSSEHNVEPAAGLRLPASLAIFWKNRGSAQCEPPYLVVSASHFIRIDTLAHIARHHDGQHRAFVDQRNASVVQVLPSRVEDLPPCQTQPLPPGVCIPLTSQIESDMTQDWLLAAGIKEADGFMARNFDRHISLAISRALLNTSISPTQMTILSCLLGLSGTFFFLLHGWGAHMTGAMLVWLHSVLDGCDGELARIRFQETPLGADIDFWGDNVVHVSLFACLAAGFARADASPLPLLAGLMAMVGILGSASLVYRQRIAHRAGARQGDSSGPKSRLARLEKILEQRDFIYLLLLLAYLQRTYEFLWAGAVGVLLFFAMTIYIGRVNREQTFQPRRAS